MLRKIDWESQIGRRLRLRDLHVFSTVVQRGSMAKAAQQLGVSQPAVSEVIADLEHALGVRLLDRSAQGIEPTIYGDALVKRSVAVFDELKQSIRDIEFLSDATTGEVRIGCMEAPWFTLLPDAIRRFSQQYPRIQVHTDLIDHSEAFLALRERRYDCVLIPPSTRPQDKAADDLTTEILYDDKVIVAASARSKWARRRKIDLAELIDEPWILSGPTALTRPFIERIFEAAGLSHPNPRIATGSIILRARLIAGSPYLGIFLTSVLQRLIADNYALTVLPVDLRANTQSVAIVTLKNRTLSPVVERFLACVREVAASLAGKQGGRAARPATEPGAPPLPLVGRGRGQGSGDVALQCSTARAPTPTLPHKGTHKGGGRKTASASTRKRP
jgi:DNA-binding transcriptional LysR family regulator